MANTSNGGTRANAAGELAPRYGENNLANFHWRPANYTSDVFHTRYRANMRYILQAVCVVAIAIGGGLFAYGSYLIPRPDPANPMDAIHSFNVDKHTREVASAARGVGIGFMMLGGLGLIVPWVNIAMTRRPDEFDAQARALAEKAETN
jgi:hypothetical protein